MCAWMCKCAPRLKRGIRTVGVKNLKKYKKNAQSPIIDGRLTDRPDHWHGNPIKPDQTRDDVGENLANAIVAGFRRIPPYPKESISFDSFDFQRIQIGRHDKKHSA